MHMNSTLRHLAATVLVAAGLSSAATAASINCPVTQVRREVTTQLPNGWWSTPLVSRLTGTAVVTISGRKALQCLYGPNGAGGRIQQYSPGNLICTAVAGGFNCAIPAAPEPVTYSTKALAVPQTFTFDIDQGSVGGNSANTDFWFQAETATRLYLVPRNGAKIGIGDGSNRGYEGCRTERMTSSRVSLHDIPVGTYVCARTSEGRISQFRVNGLSSGSPRTLNLGYTTWR